MEMMIRYATRMELGTVSALQSTLSVTLVARLLLTHAANSAVCLQLHIPHYITGSIFICMCNNLQTHVWRAFALWGSITGVHRR